VKTTTNNNIKILNCATGANLGGVIGSRQAAGADQPGSHGTMNWRLFGQKDKQKMNKTCASYLSSSLLLLHLEYRYIFTIQTKRNSMGAETKRFGLQVFRMT
jgi:hypothetical protein